MYPEPLAESLTDVLGQETYIADIFFCIQKIWNLPEYHISINFLFYIKVQI